MHSNAEHAWDLRVCGEDTTLHVRPIAQHGTAGPSNEERSNIPEDRLDRSSAPGVLASMDVNGRDRS
jgi:hypothetical protein